MSKTGASCRASFKNSAHKVEVCLRIHVYCRFREGHHDNAYARAALSEQREALL